MVSLRDSILVPMKDPRQTVRHTIILKASYDKEAYRHIMRDRWDPYEDFPIEESGRLVYLLRRIVNSDPSRIDQLRDVLQKHKKLIVFYNFNYELEMLRSFLDDLSYVYGEWNGQKHESIPISERWVYLVQYIAGSEGWNCTETNAILFFSQNYSYRTLEQASGRIDRINTKFSDLYYYHLRSVAPIDLAIAKALKEKKLFNEKTFLKEV